LGVLELETSSALTGALYPMNVTLFPSVERFSASSDLEGKLVTALEVGMAKVSTSTRLSPITASRSRTMGEVTPKLPSWASLAQTPG
jgi:hypothetical protein